ncbi:hypothetical protein RI367_001665 [Sorochytrium milnesiophthora]
MNFDRRARSQRGSTYLRRILRFPHMDFELAFWQLGYLIINPRKVYQNIYYHKQTKNQWSRDDPAFVVLLSGLILLSSIVWGLVYRLGVGHIVLLFLRMLFLDFLAVGFAVAFVGWFLGNRLRHASTPHTTTQSVEYLYSFDVHCNAMVPYMLVTHVLQLVCLPLVRSPSIAGRVMGDTFYAVACGWYVFVTFWGYNALPFLLHPEIILYAVGIIGVLWIVGIVTSVSWSLIVLQWYFATP